METASYIVTIVCLVLAMPLLIQILPQSFACLLRSREIINFERSLSRARSRNALFMLLLFPFCFFCARYRVIPCPRVALSEGFLPALGWTLAYVLGYFIVRVLLTLLFGPRKGEERIVQTSRWGTFTLFIPLVVVMVFTVALTLPFAPVHPYLTRILQAEILLFYVIGYLRRLQVYSSFCSFFGTRWYLLTTELLPAAVLVAACIWIP